jgi:hypothetical protein
MTTLAERDNLINHLQSLITSHKMFLGGGAQLTTEERNKLGGLKEYLEGIGSGGKRDLEIVSDLLTLK